VIRYEVDFAARTVSYYGSNGERFGTAASCVDRVDSRFWAVAPLGWMRQTNFERAHRRRGISHHHFQ
jgi:hypothetical protein